VITLQARHVFKKNEGATTVTMKNLHVSRIMQNAKRRASRMQSACFGFVELMGGLTRWERLDQPRFCVFDRCSGDANHLASLKLKRGD
jgi:hypothetical protein